MASRIPVLNFFKFSLFGERLWPKWAILILLISFLGHYGLNEILDAKFSLCSIRCRHVYGQTQIPGLDRQITGNRPLFFPSRCDCYEETPAAKKFLGHVSWHELGRAGSWNESVCATDGQTYPSQQDACLNNTVPLHGGTCGACSNENDIEVYRNTSKTMSQLAYHCMQKYMLDSEPAAIECFQVTGLTTDCTRCWVDNMKCSASSCLFECIWHNMIHNLPWDVNATLNPCIHCDEVHCGPAFVKCAGANRRRAGIVSDISRPHDDVWKRTAC